MRNKPEVTRVEEWTKAEIGVGAAIANGNHGENGKIALFVIKVTPKRKTTLVGATMEVKEKRSG